MCLKMKLNACSVVAVRYFEENKLGRTTGAYIVAKVRTRTASCLKVDDHFEALRQLPRLPSIVKSLKIPHTRGPFHRDFLLLKMIHQHDKKKLKKKKAIHAMRGTKGVSAMLCSSTKGDAKYRLPWKSSDGKMSISTIPAGFRFWPSRRYSSWHCWYIVRNK